MTERIDRTLSRLGQSDASVHAVLLYGPKGAGQDEGAQRLAQAWLCIAPVEGLACGECPACLAFQRNNAIDLLKISPGGKSDQIKVEAIEEPKPGSPVDPTLGPPMLKFIMTSPIRSPRKVVLIKRVERMSSVVFNSILKALEEPPPRVRYVLTADDLGSVPATILSRCVCLSYELPDPSSLGAQTEYEVVLSEGAPGMLDRIRGESEAYAKLWATMESMTTASRISALKYAEAFRECGDGFSEAVWISSRAINAELLRCLGLWLRHRYPAAVSTQRKLVTAHRRVVGNANFATQTDPLFCHFFAHR